MTVLVLAIDKPMKTFCHNMKFNAKRVDYWERKDATQLILNIIDEVTVITDAYDMFSLVVDLGSALGPWLGPSAIDIFGTTIDIFANSYLLVKSKIILKLARGSDGTRN